MWETPVFRELKLTCTAEENSLWKQPFKLYADSSAVIVHIHRDQKDGFRGEYNVPPEMVC